MFDHIWRIYRYRNVRTDESYVGQTTKNVNERAGKGKNYRKGTKFRTAIDTYGWENFEQSILRLCTSQEDADYWEKYFIDKFDSINNGYNTCLGDGGGCFLDRHHTEDSKRKASESLKGQFAGEKHPMYGKTGKSNPNYGRHQTEEACRKISENHWDCSGEKHPNYGKTWLNNGTVNIYINLNTTEVPKGFVKGRLNKKKGENIQ